MIKYYDIYEAEYTFLDDIVFCESLISGKKILEVGCGSGRVLRYLKNKGNYDLSGIDIDAEAVRIAKNKFEGEDVKLSVDDAVTFKYATKYDSILFLFNGLMHVTSKEDQISFLSNAYDHLHTGGSLIFYVSNPDIDRMSEQFPYYKYQKTLQVDNVLVDKFEYNRYDLDNQLIHRVFNYEYTDDIGNLKRLTSRFVVSFFYKEELNILLRNLGFRFIDFYGNFDGSTWTSKSPHILVKASK